MPNRKAKQRKYDKKLRKQAIKSYKKRMKKKRKGEA